LAVRLRMGGSFPCIYEQADRGWGDGPDHADCDGLAAGASAGSISAPQDDFKDAVRTAYAKLRGLAEKRVAGNPVPMRRASAPALTT